MKDLFIISNRAPFSFSEDFLTQAATALSKNIQPKTPAFGEGGLVQAMSGLLKSGQWKTTWLGASMGDKDIDVTRGHYAGLFRKMKRGKHAPTHFPLIEIDPDTRMHFKFKDYDFFMRFVFFDLKHMQSYYRKFSNGFLWPLMHLTCAPVFYKKTITFPRPYFEKSDFVQYTGSSVTFANTLIDEIKKCRGFKENGHDIVVWNQDYHLMQISEIFKALLKEEEFTREEDRKIHTGQFIHTPFFNIHEIQGLIREDKRTRIKEQVNDPFAENIESVLQKITWGMLANDFIGFQTKEYCDNYLEALEEWFPVDIRFADRFYEISYQDQVTTIGAFPIGLDVDKILFEVKKGKRLSYRVKKESLYGMIKHDKSEKRVIFGGLERCDYTKGLVERLAIFSHTCKKLKSSGREARFYQVSAPSRSDNTDYQKLGLVLDQQVERVNSQLGHNPVIYLSKGIPAPQNYRFMKEIDVMMVTPLEDGMNLVAFEYILSQKYKSPQNRGILVLSTSGASRVLKQKGFGEIDGVVYVNTMRPGEAGERISQALKKDLHLSEEVIQYVEKERRIDDWANKNIEAILNCRKNTLIHPSFITA